MGDNAEEPAAEQDMDVDAPDHPLSLAIDTINEGMGDGGLTDAEMDVIRALYGVCAAERCWPVSCRQRGAGCAAQAPTAGCGGPRKLHLAC